MSSDSPELEALFDSIAFASEATAPASGDAPELEVLFDSIAAAMEEINAAPPEDDTLGHIHAQLGKLTRRLHDHLHALCGDAAPPEFAVTVAQATSRTCAAGAAAQAIEAGFAAEAEALSDRWDRLAAGQMGVEAFKYLAADTHAYLKAVPTQTAAIVARLKEIDQARDELERGWHDLDTRLKVSRSLEKELAVLLLETAPTNKRQGTLPASDATTSRSEASGGHESVDALLARLGF